MNATTTSKNTYVSSAHAQYTGLNMDIFFFVASKMALYLP